MDRNQSGTLRGAVQTALWALLALGHAQAGPQNGVVKAGAATISTGGATTTINQSSDRAVIDWSAFSIASGESVIFNQPSSQSAILNRVTGNQVSMLEGSLTANGQVYLVNPNGVLIGQGATLDVGSFIATTANIATADFMASPASANGRYIFDQVTSASSTGSIVNLGTITAADGGLVALVAPAVRNAGVITAKLGKITLASANIFTLDLYGDDLVRLAVSDQVGKALTDVSGTPVTAQVNVSGRLSADGGQVVLLSVPVAAGIVDASINLSGIARAQSVAGGQPGEILLLAAGGDIKVSGQLDATGPAAGLAGGTIEVFANQVGIGPTAQVNVSGAAGGGLVALGGTLDYAGSAIQTQTTTVAYGATVSACGTPTCSTDGSGGTGNGGIVRLYSAHGTELDGRINVSSAQGAVAGTAEVLSDLGTTTLGTMSQIIAHTGSGNPAGFAVVIGYDLSVSPGVLMDMRDY
jgi:filamentous hemagglutinin family protein